MARRAEDLLGRALLDLFGELVLGDDMVHARQARDQPEDVLAARDGGADLLAGEQRDVIHREHVGRGVHYGHAGVECTGHGYGDLGQAGARLDRLRDIGERV